MNINEYRLYLPGEVFQHLRQGYLTLKEEQYLSSVIWSAIFLEAFLNKLLDELDVARQGQEDLNCRVQQLRQYSKNHGPNRPDVPDEIVKRCDEIRNTRNRLVHHTGLPKNTLQEDATYVFAGLEVVLDWYKETLGVAETEKSIKEEEISPRIPVFLSTITPHNEHQSYFLEMFCARLREIGIEPVRAEITIYDKKDPIGKICNVIKGCKGLIVVGLERSHAYFLRDKEGTDKQKEEIHRKYTSGWLHLEAGIANAFGLPIFVLCENDICSDGIFDRDWNSYPVVEIHSLEEDSKELKQFFGHLKSWVEEAKI